MAKVGEGDQRWIVKEREDGKNCNNWHWSEKSLTAWSKERLTELLTGVVALDEGEAKGWCKVTEIDKFSGDVTVQSRKQKKFPLYELEITLKWEGQLWDEAGKVKVDAKGKIKIPDLSEETYDDLEMTVACDDESAAKRPLKEAMRLKGAKRIREACALWVAEVKKNVYNGDEAAMVSKRPPPSERVNNQYVVSGSESKKTSQIKISYEFNPPPHVLYETLLDTDRIRGATASDASMSKEVGGKFTMFSGSVEGVNEALSPWDTEKGEAKIVWKWRFNTWQPGQYSKVEITLSDKDGATKLQLVQTGVPEEEKERTEKGWNGLLFDRLKAMLGGSVAR